MTMSWKEESENKAFLEGEVGSFSKKFGDLSIALVYPGNYSAGMSGLGFQKIYRELNLVDIFRCERAFTFPSKGYSLERAERLCFFDVVSFSVCFELQYLKIAEILKSGGIPVSVNDRGDRDPIVTAGGICIFMNPVPLYDIVDVFWVGEFESKGLELYHELLKSKGLSRRERLKRISEIPGCLVPSVNDKKKHEIIRAGFENMESSCSSIVSDGAQFKMWLVEVSRGCSWSCRFCAVKWVCGAARYRNKRFIFADIREGLSRGLKIGLVGPSILDHPYIEEICEGIVRANGEFSISSARVERLTENLVSLLVSGGIRQVTIAPETADCAIRKKLNKKFDDEKVFNALSICLNAGIESVKLYFMYGFPFEEDVAGFGEFISKAGKIINISVSCSPFVPKPHTPLQWDGTKSKTKLKALFRGIRSSVKFSRIKDFGGEDIKSSLVQAALSRSGREVFHAVMAGRMGSKEAEALATRKYEFEYALPWDSIITGCDKELLWKERGKAFEEK